MKRIKKYDQYINELFDTEELKSQVEIDYLTKKIPLRKMVSNVIKSGSFEDISAKLSFKYPFFVQPNSSYFNCTEGPNNVFHFNFNNESWQISLNIDTNNDPLYTVVISYAGVNYIPKTAKDVISIYGRNLEDKNPNKFIAEFYENKTWNQVENIVDKFFIPTFKELGFGALLSMASLYNTIKN